MATIQIARTKGTETVTETAVTQRQSLDVVQTTLHSALSSITYLRSLFPLKAFKSQSYDTNGPFFSYIDYANGNLPPKTGAPKGRRVHMEVLRRGGSKRVDIFLDWLEHGAFAALRDGNLKSLKVCVHPGPGCREKILETYQFEITYHQLAGEGVTDSRQHASTPQDGQVGVQATYLALQHFLNETMSMCRNLPDLPPERSISMTLSYVREVAQLCKGFVENDDNKPLMYASADGWEMHEHKFKALDSNSHSSTLQIAHLQPEGYVFENYDDIHPPSVPEALMFGPQNGGNQQTQERTVVELDSTSPIRCAPQSDINIPCASATPSTVIEENTDAACNIANVDANQDQSSAAVQQHQVAITTDIDPTTAQIDRGDDRRASRASQRLLSQIGSPSQSQLSNIFEMRSSLNNMMQPEYYTQGDTQTQVPTLSSPSPGLVHQRSDGFRLSPRPIRPSKPALSQSAAVTLEKERKRLRLKAQKLAQTANQGYKGKYGRVLCQCASNKEESEMVQCATCQTWQHLNCYGYNGVQDERRPDTHVCYECLLDGEQETLEALKDLVMKRRAMNTALLHGLRTQSTLATAMGIEPAEAKRLHTFMKKQGYVYEAKGSRSRGFSSSGKPMFLAVTEGPAHAKMLEDLFDPLQHISHLYEAPEDSSLQKAGRTVRAEPATTDMPPPKTPASRLRRMKAAETPASGLDLRESMTPFRTPRRVSSATKRHLEDAGEDGGEVVAATPAARRTSKRLKSVRTEFMLDAGGLSSSPAPDV